MRDDQLDPAERAVIDVALGHEGPPDGAHGRVRAAVLAQVAAGATVATVATAATAKTLLTKIVIVAAIGGVGTGAVLLTQDEPAAAPISLPMLVASADAPPPPKPAPPKPAPPKPAPPRPETLTAAPPTTKAAPSPAPAPQPQPVPVAAQPNVLPPEPPTQDEAAKPPTVQDEVALLQRAQRKIQSGDADGALELLDAHEKTHTGGALGQERQAARVIALCRAGRVAEARAAAAAFLAQSPDSPLAQRVRSALVGKRCAP